MEAHYEMITNYYNPPINYNIFSTIKKEWAWSSEATTEENEVNIPSFYCEDCNYYVGDFEHTEKFIENGFTCRVHTFVSYKKIEPKSNDKVWLVAEEPATDNELSYAG
jgi:hypothetical protein